MIHGWGMSLQEVIKTIEDRVKKNKAAANTATSGEASTSKLPDTSATTTAHQGSPVKKCGPSVEQCDPPEERHVPPMERRGPPVRLADESEIEEVDLGGSLSDSESLTNVSYLFGCEHLLGTIFGVGLITQPCS